MNIFIYVKKKVLRIYNALLNPNYDM